ncbi:hypothetical protein A5814_002729 [Enterococcus faecium]|nr:hypothetical protein A5814_002729 [Enterococcus faecium]
MFCLRLLLYHKFRKELSEQKAMTVLKKYLPQIYLRAQNSTKKIYTLLAQLLTFLRKYGVKSIKNETNKYGHY